MKRKMAFLPVLLMFFSLLLSACSGLLPLEDEPASGTFGPSYSAKEHQERTFDVLWKNLQDSYIYYDSANVNWDELHGKYVSEINSGISTDAFSALLKDLEKDLPPGSFSYQSRAERLQTDLANSSNPSSFEGIGAIIGLEEKDTPHLVILKVIEGSPAEKAGLQTHDSIYAIDGKAITLEEGLAATSRIRGPAGSTVKLEVQSPGQAKRTLEVKRGKINSGTKLEAYNIAGTDYGYLLFPPYEYSGLDQDVYNSLQTLATNRNVKGVILDLRIAGSSPQWPLDVLLTMFHNGKMGEFYNRSQKSELTVKGQDVVGSQSMPLVILVGENTRGFSEIFAAAMQLNHRAMVVGMQTPGNVETQTPFYLPDGSRIFIESTSFRLTNGKDLGNGGVTPDVPVDARWDQVAADKDPVLDKAIEILEKSK
jgi:carboxyl-terminal processing protease